MLTGSISGKVMCQKLVQREAPSTLAASTTSLGRAWRPASSMIIMKGMKVQASITIMVSRAISAVPKKDGVSQPRNRPRLASGPKRISIMDFPTIQLTATGESMRGRRNATRKNFRARIWVLRRSAKPNAIAYSTLIAST